MKLYFQLNLTRFQNSLGLNLAIRYSLLSFSLTFILTFLIRQLHGMSFYELLADPAESAGISPLTGFFTQIGLFQWAAAIGVCLFSSSFSGKVNPENFAWRLFLNFSAVLSLLLLFDDAFQLHETYYYALVDKNNISLFTKNFFEAVFFGFYALLIGFYITRFRNFYKKTNHRILSAALICFVMSLLIDVIPHEDSSRSMLIEESFKFLGISMWLFYLADSGKRYISRCLRSPAE